MVVATNWHHWWAIGATLDFSTLITKLSTLPDGELWKQVLRYQARRAPRPTAPHAPPSSPPTQKSIRVYDVLNAGFLTFTVPSAARPSHARSPCRTRSRARRAATPSPCPSRPTRVWCWCYPWCPWARPTRRPPTVSLCALAGARSLPQSLSISRPPATQEGHQRALRSKKRIAGAARGNRPRCRALSAAVRAAPALVHRALDEPLAHLQAVHPLATATTSSEGVRYVRITQAPTEVATGAARGTAACYHRTMDDGRLRAAGVAYSVDAVYSLDGIKGIIYMTIELSDGRAVRARRRKRDRWRGIRAALTRRSRATQPSP